MRAAAARILTLHSGQSGTRPQGSLATGAVRTRAASRSWSPEGCGEARGKPGAACTTRQDLLVMATFRAGGRAGRQEQEKQDRRKRKIWPAETATRRHQRAARSLPSQNVTPAQSATRPPLSQALPLASPRLSFTTAPVVKPPCAANVCRRSRFLCPPPPPLTITISSLLYLTTWLSSTLTPTPIAALAGNSLSFHLTSSLRLARSFPSLCAVTP